MSKNGLAGLVDTADAIEARLAKASALLSVARGMRTSDIKDEIMHQYLQTIQDLVEESRSLRTRLWDGMVKSLRGGK